MGNNFIFGYNFLDFTPVMSPGEDSNYPALNMTINGHLLRHARSMVYTEVIVNVDMGSPTVLAGAMLNDVNFSDAYFEGSANLTTWPFSTQVIINEEKLVKRRKIYSPFTAFEYRYLRVRIPAQAPVARFPDIALAAFRIGTLLLCQNQVELTYNPIAGPYTCTAPTPEPIVNKFKSGGDEVIRQGSTKRALIKFGFNPTTMDQLAELRDLDVILDQETMFVFYRNNDDTQECYLCRNRVPMETQEMDQTIATNTYEFQEVI